MKKAHFFGLRPACREVLLFTKNPGKFAEKYYYLQKILESLAEQYYCRGGVNINTPVYYTLLSTFVIIPRSILGKVVFFQVFWKLT